MHRLRPMFFLLLALAFSLVPALPGCRTQEHASECALPATAAEPRWIVCDRQAAAPEREFDIFYVYPTLDADKEHPYMTIDGGNAAPLKEKTFAFVRAQTGIFSGDARIFAPFVRQLEYTRIMRFLLTNDVSDGSPDLGVHDTVAAFRFYLAHYNRGRKYVLLGHSQGAMDLYELLKRCPEITPENGFVAAYLPGLPRISTAEVFQDLAPRGIRPATGETDTGVVIGWNTQSPDAQQTFAGKGSLCINPLNWSVADTPADKSRNIEAVFYHLSTGKTERVPHFTGAAIDLERGALIVDLPSMSRYDARGFMGKGVFHMNDIWFFAGNIRKNMLDRVAAAKKAEESRQK